jgi:hypothetical protein
MRKEKTTHEEEIKCDFCKAVVEDPIRYGGILTYYDAPRLVVSNGSQTKEERLSLCMDTTDLDFCDLDCAKQYLKKHKGIRFLGNEEAECPREGEKGFCQQCPAFNVLSLVCEDSNYWIRQGYSHPKSLTDPTRIVVLPEIIFKPIENIKIIRKALGLYQRLYLRQNRESAWKKYLFIPNSIRDYRKMDIERDQRNLFEMKKTDSSSWDCLWFTKQASNLVMGEQDRIKQLRFDFKLHQIRQWQFKQYMKDLITKIKDRKDLIYGNLLIIYASLGTLSHTPKYRKLCDLLQNELIKFDETLKPLKEVKI